jgi:hypothetical protein
MIKMKALAEEEHGQNHAQNRYQVRGLPSPPGANQLYRPIEK